MKEVIKRDGQLTTLLQVYLDRQANPDRVGCPTFETLEVFFRGQAKQDVVQGLYEHLPRCRECLLELKMLNDIIREEAQEEERVGRRDVVLDNIGAVFSRFYDEVLGRFDVRRSRAVKR